MIPLLQTKTADTVHTGIFASVTRPLSQFLGGPGDEAILSKMYRTDAPCMILIVRGLSVETFKPNF